MQNLEKVINFKQLRVDLVHKTPSYGIYKPQILNII